MTLAFCFGNKRFINASYFGIYNTILTAFVSHNDLGTIILYKIYSLVFEIKVSAFILA
jgi:hypothetical protein